MNPHPNRVPALYFKETLNGIRCQLCHHACLLKRGETGICRSRQNINGVLIALNFGNLCALHIDPIEKKPLYHFLPGTKALSIATAGCNLRCLNCQNSTISQCGPEDVTTTVVLPTDVVKLAHEKNCPSIAYTYTEPLMAYEYVLETARLAREAGLKNVLVSAAHILEPPLRYLVPYIDAANIDLKCFDGPMYKKLSGGNLQLVLRSLNILRESGVWLEITNLIIPGYTDNEKMIEKMCQWLAESGFQDYPLHFSRFFPSHQLLHLQPTPVETLHRFRKLAMDHGIRHVYLGNVPGVNGQHTVCPACETQLVKRLGYEVTFNGFVDGVCFACGRRIAGKWD
jgi:pyruvate formate lyase activating enzyme